MKSILINQLAPILLFGALMTTSCSHYYYVPNVQNVPLFREKNEYHLAAYYGGGDESACAEIQTAYSVTNNFGVMANFMSAKGDNDSRQSSAKGYCFEGAIGYYKPLGKSDVFEVYGGYGGGNQHHTYYDGYNHLSDGTADLSFSKLFVQPSFGMTYNLFDIAFSTRICRLSYNKINNHITGYSFENENINTLSDKNHFFAEPAITVRGGWKNFKLQVQAEYSGYLNSPKLDFFEDYHLSVGLHFTIAERYKPRNIPASQ
jgi:hypothetical protein